MENRILYWQIAKYIPNSETITTYPAYMVSASRCPLVWPVASRDTNL